MQEARSAIQSDAVLRKLNMHIMVKFCLLVRAVHAVSGVYCITVDACPVATDDGAAAQTLLNHMDRANLVSNRLQQSSASYVLALAARRAAEAVAEAAHCMQAYASVQLNQDLGYSDSVYGAAAGVFFVSYAVFQVSDSGLLGVVSRDTTYGRSAAPQPAAGREHFCDGCCMSP